MDVLMIVLRLIHILSGVFWAGTAFFFVSFLEPTVEAAGPEGGKFMQKLAQTRFAIALSMAGLLTVLSGLLMYWRDSGGFQVAWITTPTGLAFAVGGLAGILAFLIGFFVSRPAVARMTVIGQQAQAAGGPPSPEQMAEIQALQKRVGQGALRVALLLTVALIGMSVARYL